MFKVAEAGRYRLQRAPLAQALVQVTFPLLGRFQSLDGVAALQEQLAGLLPYMERQQVSQLSFSVGGDGALVAGPQESTAVWKFTDDNGWTLALTPGSAILSVGASYRGIDDFARRFETVLNALANLDGPPKIQRCNMIQVRYIDLISSPPEDPKAWNRWIKPELTGWVGNGVMGENTTLVSQLTQTQLTAPLAPRDGSLLPTQGLIRHGFLPQNSVIPGVPPIAFLNVILEQASYTIDMELSIQQPQPFVPTNLIAQFSVLHAQIDAFFKWALTSEGKDHFGLEELS